MKKIIIFLIFLIMLFSVSVKAEEQPLDSSVDNSKIEELYHYINNMKMDIEILNGMDVKSYIESFLKDGHGNLSFKNIGKGLLSYSMREIVSCSKFMVVVVVIALICALFKNIQSAFNNDSLSNIAYFACYSLLIIVLSRSFIIAIDMVKETISGITNFMAALIPVLLMLLSTVGGLAEAATMDPIALAAINLTPRIYVDFIIPLILMGFVLNFVNNISEEYKISKLSKLVNQVVLWSQGIVMTIFIGIITIRGVTSSTLDAVTAKTAKFAVDNFVPIVGKALSDAVATVAGYSLLLKNAISSLGLIVILIIVIMPIIKLFIMSMIYRLTAALIEPISDKRIVDSVSSVGDSIMLIMSSLICISVMFFIMLSIMASTGKFVLGA